MPTVFVTQVPSKFDPEKRVFTPTVNIGPASIFGSIRVIMPSDAAFYETVQLVRKLDEAFDDYDYDAGDSVLPLGDPAIIAVVGGILGNRGEGKFRLLKWDRRASKYNSVEIAIP